MNKNNQGIVDHQLAKAIQHHQSGELAKAKSLYSKVIKKHSHNTQALYLLGLLYHQQSEYAKSIKSLKRALSIKPNEQSFINALTNAIVAANDGQQLEWLIQHCSIQKIDHSAISIKLANLRVRKNQVSSAVTIFESLLEQQKEHWNLWLEFGNCLFLAAQLDRAKGCYQQVLLLAPEQVDALNNLAAIAVEQNDLNGASDCIARVLKQDSQHKIARYNFANILYQQQKWVESKEILRALVSDSPDYFDAHMLEAKIDRAIGNHASAFTTYQALLDANYNSDRLFNDIGNCYYEIKDFENARTQFNKALLFSDKSADARFNLATCSLQLRDYDAAIKEFATLLENQPNYYSAYAPYLHALRQSCLWLRAERVEQKLRSFLDKKDNINIPPFSMITLESSTSQEQIKVAHHWINRQSIPRVKQPSKPIKSKTTSKTKIRLGYLSADFHNHATAILLIRILELHDREQFECFAYSYGANDESKLRKRVENSVGHFRDLFNTPKQEMINIIKKDELDILIDLKGFTQNTMSEVLLARLAPVQINYLGYPGSMGKALVDYVIVDEFIVQSEKVRFEETPLLMPNSYQPTDNTRKFAKKPIRTSLGLNDEQFVFAAFHQGYKLNQKTLQAWGEILNQCPNSVLWCLSLSDSAKAVIQETLASSGVDSSRIIFAEKVSPEEHIARLQCADLVLDSFPVNGHTTTSDSLWVGVPVVTIAGDTFISRVAGSLLTAVHLPEFICEDYLSYQEKAIDCYNNRHSLKLVSKNLMEQKLKLSLFESEQYARDLESIFRDVLASKY